VAEPVPPANVDPFTLPNTANHTIWRENTTKMIARGILIQGLRVNDESLGATQSIALDSVQPPSSAERPLPAAAAFWYTGLHRPRDGLMLRSHSPNWSSKLTDKGPPEYESQYGGH
jgi:hypothetical protein